MPRILRPKNPLIGTIDADWRRFIPTGDPSRVFCIYHATGNPADGWNNRKAHVCTLGPEVLLQNRTLICGDMPLPTLHGQAGYPGGPQGQSQAHGHRGLFDKMRDKLREL